MAVAAGAAATLVAGVAIAATVYSSYGATSTSNMVDGNHTTYGVLQALTGGSMPSCPPGFSYWINSGAGTRGCIKGLSSSWRIMGWTLIDLGPSIGTSCGTGCTVVPAWDAANQGDGNPNASGGSCTSGCTAKYRVFSTHYLNGGSTVWTHPVSVNVVVG